MTVYTLASTIINQSAPNLVEMYVTVRSRMNYTMDLIRTEHLRVICTWIIKTAIIEFAYTLASANIDQTLGQNMYDQQISNEFNYESTWTGTTGVICS